MTTELSRLWEEKAASDGSIWLCGRVPLGIPARRTTKSTRADVSKKEHLNIKQALLPQAQPLCHYFFRRAEMYKACKASRVFFFFCTSPRPDPAGGHNRRDKKDSGTPHFLPVPPELPSGCQLTCDLAQLRILPRCPARFVARSPRPSTPLPFFLSHGFAWRRTTLCQAQLFIQPSGETERKSFPHSALATVRRVDRGSFRHPHTDAGRGILPCSLAAASGAAEWFVRVSATLSFRFSALNLLHAKDGRFCKWRCRGNEQAYKVLNHKTFAGLISPPAIALDEV